MFFFKLKNVLEKPQLISRPSFNSETSYFLACLCTSIFPACQLMWKNVVQLTRKMGTSNWFCNPSQHPCKRPILSYQPLKLILLLKVSFSFLPWITYVYFTFFSNDFNIILIIMFFRQYFCIFWMTAVMKFVCIIIKLHYLFKCVCFWKLLSTKQT